ncbi:hypothetical protein, partial [Aliikangiella maris]
LSTVLPLKGKQATTLYPLVTSLKPPQRGGLEGRDKLLKAACRCTVGLVFWFLAVLLWWL